MSRHLASYLKPLRVQRGLSQSELAKLLGISASLLSLVESLARRPTARVILPAEIVFGMPAREIFPEAYRDIENEVVLRGRSFEKQLKRHPVRGRAEKQRFVNEVMKRLARSKKGA